MHLDVSSWSGAPSQQRYYDRQTLKLKKQEEHSTLVVIRRGGRNCGSEDWERHQFTKFLLSQMKAAVTISMSVNVILTSFHVLH